MMLSATNFHFEFTLYLWITKGSDESIKKHSSSKQNIILCLAQNLSNSVFELLKGFSLAVNALFYLSFFNSLHQLLKWNIST